MVDLVKQRKETSSASTHRATSTRSRRAVTAAIRRVDYYSINCYGFLELNASKKRS